MHLFSVMTCQKFQRKTLKTVHYFPVLQYPVKILNLEEIDRSRNRLNLCICLRARDKFCLIVSKNTDGCFCFFAFVIMPSLKT